jgi:hypothetical protein
VRSSKMPVRWESKATMFSRTCERNYSS